MMPSFSVGSQEVERAVRKLTEDSQVIKDAVKRVVARSTLTIHRQAVDNVPRNDGMLRNSLRTPTFTDGGLTGMVSTNAFYAPYVEFGTKRRFGKISPHARDKTQLDAETREIAAQYRGSAGRGNARQFFVDIKKWCRQKGLPQEAAGAIALSILRHGIYAQPFLFPAARRERPRYMKNLQQLIDKANRGKR